MTGIEWTRGDDGTPGTTWNPVTGCDRVSPGCDNCYALTMAGRLKGMGADKYQNDGDPATSGPGFGITTHPDTLTAPLRWTKPRRVFVNSMSDLFHDGVDDDFIARVWAVMAATPRHTFQILTKRHGRMRSLLNRDAFRRGVAMATWELAMSGHDTPPLDGPVWPLPNVHLGVSAENQKWTDLRVPALLSTPAAVRWVSAEPLLGPVALPAGLDWVVVGGESGPRARPCEEEWVRGVVDQCAATGTPVFVKQLGSVWAKANGGRGKGNDPARWPAGLDVQQTPA